MKMNQYKVLVAEPIQSLQGLAKIYLGGMSSDGYNFEVQCINDPAKVSGLLSQLAAGIDLVIADAGEKSLEAVVGWSKASPSTKVIIWSTGIGTQTAGIEASGAKVVQRPTLYETFSAAVIALLPKNQ